MKNILFIFAASFLFAAFSTTPQVAQTETQRIYVLKLKAKDSFQRTMIANTGAAIDFVNPDYVIATALLEEKNQLQKMGLILEDVTTSSMQTMAFPNEDTGYHDYSENRLPQSA